MDISTLLGTNLSQPNLLSSMQNLTATTSKATDPLAAILQAQDQLLTLSAIGKTTNKASQVAQLSNDPNVMAGLQQTVNAIASQPLNVQSFSLLQTINKMATQDTEALNGVFSTVSTLVESGFSGAVSSYLDTVNTAYNQSGATAIAALNNSITDAITADGATTSTILHSLSSLFQQYQNTTTTAVSAVTPKTTILAEDPSYFPALTVNSLA